MHFYAKKIILRKISWSIIKLMQKKSLDLMAPFIFEWIEIIVVTEGYSTDFNDMNINTLIGKVKDKRSNSCSDAADKSMKRKFSKKRLKNP